MKIIIKDQIQPKTPPTEVYKFKIKLMGGDADVDFRQEVIVKHNHPYLERFLIFLNDCKNLYPRGKRGNDDYTSIPDFYLFCAEDYPDNITDEELEILDNEIESCEDLRFYWESNYEYHGVSSYNGCIVTYFDENGYEFECEIIE